MIGVCWSRLNTVQLYDVCVGKFAFWLVIYRKHSVHFTIKHATIQQNMKLKTAQIQTQYITLTMFIQTHKYVRVYINTHTHTSMCTHTESKLSWANTSYNYYWLNSRLRRFCWYKPEACWVLLVKLKEWLIHKIKHSHRVSKTEAWKSTGPTD